MTQNSANGQNVDGLPIASTSDRKNWLTRKAKPQFIAVQNATGRPRMRPGTISLITVHVTVPIEKAKKMMKATGAIQGDDAHAARRRQSRDMPVLRDEMECDPPHG